MFTTLGIYTIAHVVISLIAIAVGIPAIIMMLSGKTRSAFVFWFYTMTALTCFTGFGFPVKSITPAHILGVITLGLLSISYLARVRSAVQRSWRLISLLAAISCLYLNTFVLIVQSFQKISFLNSLAPTQTEPPFFIAHFIGISIFGPAVWKSLSISKQLG